MNNLSNSLRNHGRVLLSIAVGALSLALGITLVRATDLIPTWSELWFRNQILIGVPTDLPPLPATQPTPSALDTHLTNVDSSLDDLKNAGLTVYLPSPVPAGFQLTKVIRVVNDKDPAYLGAGLTYQGNFNGGLQVFTLRYEKLLLPRRIYIRPESIIEKVDINGQLGVAYDPDFLPGSSSREGRAVFTWFDHSYQLEIRGNVGLDKLVEFARSIKPH